VCLLPNFTLVFYFQISPKEPQQHAGYHLVCYIAVVIKQTKKYGLILACPNIEQWVKILG
jgi:hypothetical protein